MELLIVVGSWPRIWESSLEALVFQPARGTSETASPREVGALPVGEIVM